MARSKCTACGKHTFEIQLVEPQGAAYRHYLIQCAACGVPVGVTEYRNASKLIEELQKHLDKGMRGLSGQIENVAKRLERLERSR